MAADLADAACARAAWPLPGGGGALDSWAQVKRVLVELTMSTKEGMLELNRNRDDAFDLVYNYADAAFACPLGHYSLRMALYLLVNPSDRNQNLCEEQSPFELGLGVVDVLASGWPIFGLFGLLSYRTVRDGTARRSGGGAPECPEEVESWRVRYAPAAFENADAAFSRDVERHVGRHLPALEGPPRAAAAAAANTTQRCLLGMALPFLGHAASLQCLARRDAALRGHVARLLGAAESALLRPAGAAARGPATAAAARACPALARARRRPDHSALALLAAGLWAGEAAMLLQRCAPAFAAAGPRPPLGGPEPDPGGDIVVSFDPHEDRFYGRGLPEFVGHTFGEGAAKGFRVRHAVPCADVLVVRDSLPEPPFPGALLYVDHEAGLGPGRDAGRLDDVLGRQYRVVYLGVLEPLAETRCLSRWGSAAARGRRACAKVFSGRAASPAFGLGASAGSAARTSPAAAASPNLIVEHVPFASSSFAGRKTHAPIDLSVAARPFVEKKRFLAYVAYTCVDHRERLFDLLADEAVRLGLGPADALSRCAGYRSGHRRARNHSRGNAGALEFLDEAVELLRPYRFALVFENKLVPGYVTEKIVNAFLAGCIPIYWGSRAALDMFNRDALVYANELQGPGDDYAAADPLVGLERVVDAVASLAADPAALRRVATAPVLSQAQLHRYFSWHPSARATPPGAAPPGAPAGVAGRLGDALHRALAPRQRLGLCGDGAGARMCAKAY